MEGTLVMPTYLPITRVLFIGTWYRIVAGQTSRLPRAFSYHYVAVRLDTIFSRKQKQTSNVCRYHEQRFQRPFKRLSYQQDKIKKKEKRKKEKKEKRKRNGKEEEKGKRRKKVQGGSQRTEKPSSSLPSRVEVLSMIPRRRPTTDYRVSSSNDPRETSLWMILLPMNCKVNCVG